MEDDLCVLVRPASGGWVLVAGCVCSPSHWVLAEKLGRPLADVHDVVPGYDVELSSRVDGFLDRLRPGTVAVRRNWSIHETGERYEPSCPPALAVPPAEQWLRSEHQSLRRLPRSGAVLFSIRLDQVQLGDVPTEVRHRLGARLAAEPGPLIAYRNLQRRRAPLLDYLLAHGG